MEAIITPSPPTGKEGVPVVRFAVLLPALLVAAAACRKPSDARPYSDVSALPTNGIPAQPVGDAAFGPAIALPTPDPSWQEVLVAAKSPLPSGEHETLDRAVEQLGRLSRHAPLERDFGLRLLENRRIDDGTPLDNLPDEALAALADLRAWSENGGGLDTSDCTTDRALTIQTLGRLALDQSAPDPADPNLHAALYLAHRLREEGPTLLAVATGVEIGNDAVDRWKILPTDARPVFALYAPTTGFLLHVVAAEGLCAVRMSEETVSAGDPLWAEMARRSGMAAADDVRGFALEQLDALRRYSVSLVRKMREHPDDPLPTLDWLDRIEAEWSLGPSTPPVMSLVVSPMAGRLKGLAESAAHYRQYVDSPP